MEITMLGTGSPIPDANRAAPTALVKAGDTHILLDAGRGVVMRMTAAGSLPGMLGGVLITHFHSDHIAALNDVITTHWVMTQENATLKIFGPEGIVELVDRTLAMLEFDIGYRIAHHDEMTKGPQLDVTELKPGDSFMINDVMVATAATEHPPVSPTIGYRLEHDGVSVALVGDTNPCEGVDALAAGADAYLQSVHGADSEYYRMLRQAMLARRTLLLLDGLDEGGQVRAQIEKHVTEVLAPQGHVMLVTSRPGGLDPARFAAFGRLHLVPLSDAQQRQALKQRLGAQKAANVVPPVLDAWLTFQPAGSPKLFTPSHHPLWIPLWWF